MDAANIDYGDIEFLTTDDTVLITDGTGVWLHQTQAPKFWPRKSQNWFGVPEQNLRRAYILHESSVAVVFMPALRRLGEVG